MVISGIRTSESFYNNISSIGSAQQATNELPQVSSVAPEISDASAKPSLAEIIYARRDQNQTSFDYAQKYDAQASYSLKGSESSLESLDAENEVFRMQQDQILQQYRFFVGDGASSEEAAVQQATRPVENFIL